MKRALAILMVSMVAAGWLQAQPATTPPAAKPPTTLQAAPPPPPMKPTAPVLEGPQTPVGRPAVYGGALIEAARSDRPLHAINPFAPARYGDGTQNLSRDPATGRAEGITLFSIRCDPTPKDKKSKKRGAKSGAPSSK